MSSSAKASIEEWIRIALVDFADKDALATVDGVRITWLRTLEQPMCFSRDEIPGHFAK